MIVIPTLGKLKEDSLNLKQHRLHSEFKMARATELRHILKTTLNKKAGIGLSSSAGNQEFKVIFCFISLLSSLTPFLKKKKGLCVLCFPLFVVGGGVSLSLSLGSTRPTGHSRLEAEAGGFLSSRPARATQRNPVSKNQKKKKVQLQLGGDGEHFYPSTQEVEVGGAL
jgi:hypothetical protein